MFTNSYLYRKLFNAILLTFILCSAALIVAAQDSEAANDSSLSGITLPRDAVRLHQQSVPSEINSVLGKLIESGGKDIKRGETEVLAWTKNYKKSNAPQTVKQIVENLRAGGWEYEAQNGEVTVFTLLRPAPEKRAIVGFYSFDENALVFAMTEMLRADAPAQIKTSGKNAKTDQPANDAAVFSAEKIVLNVGRDDRYVNVMGNQNPAIPQFPALSPKAERVRGYVKDWTGKPLAGAEIGIRASYFAGSYSGAQGKTDANGYYEFVVPKGSAHYYNAGYQINWGDGIAAVGLHPADGKLDSFTTADGAVENFVMLPYGITSRENLSANAHLASTYYGGSLYVGYWYRETNDNSPGPGSIVENSIIEITLTPDGDLLDGSAGKTIVVRKTVGFQSGFNIHNIPLGRYKISAKASGNSLNIKENRKFNPLFGMSPAETTGTATILFTPKEAKASMVGLQQGAWESISLTVTAP